MEWNEEAIDFQGHQSGNRNNKYIECIREMYNAVDILEGFKTPQIIPTRNPGNI